MLLHGHVYTAPNRIKGFDTNVSVTPSAAAAFFAHGFRFCVRYVGRQKAKPNDVSAGEAAALLDAGLGLMIVQHVESEDGWTPNPDKGAAYGAEAAKECNHIGVPSGVCVWCDLEGVDLTTPAEDVVGYCNAWHSAVAAEGFVPGLYVGWHAGLNRTQLYRALRFTHYWAAYNLNSDQSPAVRGVQMKQAECKPLDRVAGFDFLFQTDIVRADALGGRPTMVAPENWLE
jgi:hypothetical protein